MGGWPSQFLRHQSTTSPASSDTQAIETTSVLCEEMAARRPMVTGEHNVSAASRIPLDDPEKLSEIVNALQNAQKIISFVPTMMERQRKLEATITNNQRYQYYN